MNKMVKKESALLFLLPLILAVCFCLPSCAEGIMIDGKPLDQVTDPNAAFYNPNQGAHPSGRPARPDTAIEALGNEDADKASSAEDDAQSNIADFFFFQQNIEVGWNVVVDIAPVANAETYWLNLENAAGHRLYLNRIESAGQYTIDGLFLDAGTYNVSIRVDYYSGGYDILDKPLYVRDPGGQRIAQNIVVTANKSTIYENDTVEFTLWCAGATQFAVRSDIQYWWEEDQWLDLTGNYDIIASDQAGRALYQRYINEGGYPLCVEVRAFCQGRWSYPYYFWFNVQQSIALPKPSASIPYTIQAGTKLPVTITPAAHEHYYYVMVDDNEQYDSEFDMWFSESTFTLSDEMFEPGTHTVTIYSYSNDPGYGMCSVPFTGSVTVTGRRPAAPVLTSEKSAYLISEVVKFTGQSANADQFRFRMNYFSASDGWTGWDWPYEKDAESGKSDVSTWWLTPNDTTLVQCQARARIGGRWSEAVFLTVSILQDPNWHGGYLTLPNNLSEIEDEAFSNTSARDIVIPAGVTKIGSKAFSNLQASTYTYIDFYGTNIDIADDAFANSPNIIFYVLRGSDAEQYAIDHDIDYWYLDN